MAIFESRCTTFVPALLLTFVMPILALGQSKDSNARLINSVTYTMPASAIDADIGGTVVMGIRVDETGAPSWAVLIIGPTWPCSTNPVKAIEELGRTLSEAMMTLKFSPALENSKPVSSNISLTIQLKNPRLAMPAAPLDPTTGKPKATYINGGVLNGKAKSLPKPFYPAEARANRDSGAVSIAVVVDEEGTVVRAGAVSGAPTLQFAARDAACGAKFSPTLLMGDPIKVSGVITYNFIP